MPEEKKPSRPKLIVPEAESGERKVKPVVAQASEPSRLHRYIVPLKMASPVTACLIVGFLLLVRYYGTRDNADVSRHNHDPPAQPIFPFKGKIPPPNRKAAEQGDAEAQYDLGVIYEIGKGVTKDDAEAVKWYRKAAEQGNADAKEALKKLGVE